LWHREILQDRRYHEPGVKKVNLAWIIGKILRTMCGSSYKGRITTDLCESWLLTDHLLKYARGDQPLLPCIWMDALPITNEMLFA